jgi:hypothetical protein
MTTRRSKPAKQQKARTHGAHTVPESRARRETLERKNQPEDELSVGEPLAAAGSRSDRAMAARMGRQPVLESQHEHPAGKGAPMPRRLALAEDARAAQGKPAAAPPKRRKVAPDKEE